MKMTMRFSSLLAMLAAGWAFNGLAVTFNGVDSSGTGDLAEPTHWDGGSLPGSSAAVTFDKSGTLSASAPVAFGNVTFSPNVSAYLETVNPVSVGCVMLGADAEVTIGGGCAFTNAAHGSYTMLGARTRWTVDGEGSRWAVISDANVCSTSSGGTKIEIKNGGYASLYRGFNLQGNTNEIVIGKNSELHESYAGGGYHNVYLGSGNGCNNTIKVDGKLAIDSSLCQFYIGEGASATNNVVEIGTNGVMNGYGRWLIGISGSYNRLIAKGAKELRHIYNPGSRYIYIGQNASACHNEMYVDAETQGFNPPVVVGYAGSSNRFEVVNPKNWPAYLTVGSEATAHDNLAWIHGTNTLSLVYMKNFITFGAGTNNEAVIEGLKIIAWRDNGYFGVAGGSGNRVVFKDCDVLTGNTQDFEMTGGNRYIIDHTHWVHNGGNAILGGSHSRAYLINNANLIITGGSTVDFTNDAFYCSGRVAGTAVNANTHLEIRDGAVAQFSELRLHNSNNHVTISNATLKGCVLVPFGTGYAYPEYSTNNVFRFEGTCPQLLSSSKQFQPGYAVKDGEVWFGKTVLEFALPEEPYEKPPISAACVTLTRSTKIHIETGKKKHTGFRRYKLAEATGSANSDIIALDDAEGLAADLPAGCSLSLSADNKSLWLRVRGDSGTMIIFR